MSNVIFLIGGPCVGKSTLGRLLGERFDFVHISNIYNESLIPAHKVYRALKKEIQKFPQRTILIHGFPRSMQNLLKWNLEEDPPLCVFYLTCDDKSLTLRINERIEASSRAGVNRADDTIEVIRRRQLTFNEHITEIRQFYEKDGLIHNIDTSKGIKDEINQVCGILASLLNRKKLFFTDGASMTVQKMTSKATLPYHASALSLGYDIFSSEEGIIMPKSGRVMRTDICIKPPLGTFIKITGRSGSALKNIHVSESEFDSNYSEPIKVLLFNQGNEPFLVLEKMRIAKMNSITSH